jgi:hypothetical protein
MDYSRFIENIKLNIKNAYELLDSLSESNNINNIKRRITLFIKHQNELLFKLNFY